MDRKERQMDRIDKEQVDKFIPYESEKLEILTDLLNNDYTIEAFRQDYRESQDDKELAR